MIGTLALVVAFAIFYLSTAFALGYGTSTLHYERGAFLSVQLGAIIFMAIGIGISAHWADRTTSRHMLIVGSFWTIAVGCLMGPLMGSGSLFLVWVFLSLALFGMGLVYGPAGAFLSSLFPPRVRYTGSSICYNVGGIIGGGFAPFIAQTLADHGGLALVGGYLVAAAILSLMGLFATRAIGEGGVDRLPAPTA